MNNHLQKQQEAFKRQLLNQPIIPKAVAQSHQAPSYGTEISNIPAFIGNRPINSYIHSVISHLRSKDRPVTIAEISQTIGVDLEANAILLDKVCLNDRIYFDSLTRKLSYHPPYNLRTRSDIIPALKSQNDLEGICLSEIKDTIPKLDEALGELSKSGDIFVIRIKDDGPRVIFYNDYKITIKVSPEFKNLWSDTAAPLDDSQLYALMNQSGLKPQTKPDLTDKNTIVDDGRHLNKKKTIKRPFRRIKITNDYLEGIDLSIDVNESSK